MLLLQGVTGFDEPQNIKESIAHFKKFVYTLAIQNHLNVVEVCAPAYPENFFSAKLTHNGEHFFAFK